MLYGTSPDVCISVPGNKVEKLCDLCNITLNKNAVFGDSSALAPGGVRIGKRVELIELFSTMAIEFDFMDIENVYYIYLFL